MFYRSPKAAKISLVIFAIIWHVGLVYALFEFESKADISFLSMFILLIAMIGVNDARISIEILEMRKELSKIRH